MNLHLLIKILGGFCFLFGLAMALPAIYGPLSGSGFEPGIALPACGAIILGIVLFFSQQHHRIELDLKNSLGSVTICWLVACLLAACPFYFSGALPTFVDALFEAVSGLTGTGSTVLVSVEQASRPTLLWRSLTQWLGGVGFLFSFLTLSPALGLASGQIFRQESGPQLERLTPRFWEAARKLCMLYGFFSLALFLLLRYAGMDWFDALNHALTTVSTGGFSTRNEGIAAFHSSAIDYLVAIFMLIAAINFYITYRLLVLFDWRALASTEFKWFIGIAAVGTGIFTLDLLWTTSVNFEGAFHQAFFAVTSAISACGFTQQNLGAWPPVTHVIMIVLVVMGGMSGSTAGGVKCIRLVIAFKQMLRHFRQVVHPSAVLTIRADNQSVSLAVMEAVWSVIFMYFFVFALLCGVLAAEGFQLLSAASVSFSTLSNFGPAFGDLAAQSSYASLSDGTKITLIIGMLLGRLEFYSILVLFTPEYWRS